MKNIFVDRVDMAYYLRDGAPLYEYLFDWIDLEQDGGDGAPLNQSREYMQVINEVSEI